MREKIRIFSFTLLSYKSAPQYKKKYFLGTVGRFSEFTGLAVLAVLAVAILAQAHFRLTSSLQQREA